MTDYGTIVDEHTVRFERVLPGPIERAWDYLTKPEMLATWLAGGVFEPRVGGQVELRFNNDDMPEDDRCGAISRGTVTRWEPMSAVAYTWSNSGWQPGVPGSEVTFELSPSTGESRSVRLVLTHRRLPANEMPGFGAGWHTHLMVLEARVRGEVPEPFVPYYQQLRPDYERLVPTGVRG
jgi:uncharacterized protein YndB with AHSA1/START domain